MRTHAKATRQTIDADAFNAFEAAGWDGRADGYHRFFGAITTRVTEQLLDAAKVDRGGRVLDVASGPGYVAAACAVRGADVVGVDVAAEMVALAQRLRPEIDFRQADAEQLPFADGSFDAVVGNFLILHVGRPEHIAAELARVLRPGRKLALSTWDLPERARLLGVLVDAVAEAKVEPSADLPSGPPIFRFADEGEFARLLGHAGLGDVDVQTVAFTHRFASGDELWNGLLGGTVRTRALVLAQPERVQARIRAAFGCLVRPYATKDGLEVPVSVKLASGRKPGAGARQT
ncbi:methyltransferase domain-containing protein [Kribbella sp. NPDC050820]|uniref:class I SAM-dependent methyltransferase n=1 Tax=Kribbella sp. NPDC050820 TaxID=3155408 RepID=UPI0033F15272